MAIRRYQETGQNTNRKRSGRPRKTNQRIDNKIYAISKSNRQKSASEIRAEISEDLDLPISLTTVKRRLISGNQFYGQINQNSNFSVAIGVNMFAEKSMKDSNQIVLCQL